MRGAQHQLPLPLVSSTAGIKIPFSPYECRRVLVPIQAVHAPVGGQKMSPSATWQRFVEQELVVPPQQQAQEYFWGCPPSPVARGSQPGVDAHVLEGFGHAPALGWGWGQSQAGACATVPRHVTQHSPSSQQHQVMLCPWFKTRKSQVSGMLAPKPRVLLIQELRWGESTSAPRAGAARHRVSPAVCGGSAPNDTAAMAKWLNLGLLRLVPVRK